MMKGGNNFLLLDNIQDTLGCVLCEDLPNDVPLRNCKHGRKICLCNLMCKDAVAKNVATCTHAVLTALPKNNLCRKVRQH